MNCLAVFLVMFAAGDTPPPDTFRVAAVQTFSDMGAPETNRRRLSDLVTEAARLSILNHGAMVDILYGDSPHVKRRG